MIKDIALFGRSNVGKSTLINRIILNDALENEERPVSVSAFIRDLIEKEIKHRPSAAKEWDKTNISKLKNK